MFDFLDDEDSEIGNLFSWAAPAVEAPAPKTGGSKGGSVGNEIGDVVDGFFGVLSRLSQVAQRPTNASPMPTQRNVTGTSGGGPNGTMIAALIGGGVLLVLVVVMIAKK